FSENNNFFIFTATHSLDYFFTGVTLGISLPEFTAVGQVDGLQFAYYNSNTKKVILTADWINSDDVEHWNLMTQIGQAHEAIFRLEVSSAMKLFNQTGGIHTWQRMFGCELHDDGTKTGYSNYGYDGEDFLSLDLNTVSWIAANDKAVIAKQEWESTSRATTQKAFVENDCIQRLQKYVDYGRATLEGKVRPEVSLFQKDSSSHMVCHATGFFPKAVMITWQKNGEEVHEDVELRETLPNLDETFQRSSILTVSPEELDKHNYICIIQHISLEKEMGLRVVNRRGKRNKSSFISETVFVLIIVTVIAVWKKKPAVRSTDCVRASCSAAMELSIMKSLVFLIFGLHLASAATHSLQYVYTVVTPGINFPEFTTVGLLDGEEFTYYDSVIGKETPKMEWIKEVVDPDYWNRNTQVSQGAQESFKANLATAMKRFNQTGDT
ncbi:hypothetical protein NFI96_022549, partial [Prochilodus magdalenae]